MTENTNNIGGTGSPTPTNPAPTGTGSTGASRLQSFNGRTAYRPRTSGGPRRDPRGPNANFGTRPRTAADSRPFRSASSRPMGASGARPAGASGFSRPHSSGGRPHSRGGSTGGSRMGGGRGGSRPGGRPAFEARPSTAGYARTESTEIMPMIPPAGENIRIVPLGGVEEVGRNMMFIEYKDEIVVIDCGIQFSSDQTPGVDYILPNVKYLEENKSKIKALVITHGHLDHIGSIPYLITSLGNPPIYTREIGALFIKKRQVEFPHLPELNIKLVEKDAAPIQLTNHMKLRFFGLTHSIPDSTGVIIETPFGDIVNTGDVRVDNHNNIPTEAEVEQYKFFKDRKVLLLTMDSTGIEKPGWSLSEDVVIENIDRIVGAVGGRILIATFASQIDRLIAFLNIAKKYGRKVIIEGRSMKNNMEIIKHLGLAETDHIAPIEDIEQYAPNKIMILATGGQGEEFAALARMANNTHKSLKLNKTDTIILSSSIIPGNERSIATLKDNLYRHNPRVITYLDSDVHTSGHGKRAELEWIHKQIPYKFFMPVHGHHFMLKMHAELAVNLGLNPDNAVVPDNGSIIEIAEEGTKLIRREEKVPSNPLIVDGFAIGDMQEVVLRDRQMLAQDGMFVIIASLNTQNGLLKKSPDIISRGFVYLRESQELLHEARLIIKTTIENTTKNMNPIDFDFLKNVVSEEVSRFLFQETAKRPIVIPVILGM